MAEPMIIICPHCARDLSPDNNGCEDCGYEWPFGDENALFRIPPLGELLRSHHIMDGVAAKFLLRVYCIGEQAGIEEGREEWR